MATVSEIKAKLAAYEAAEDAIVGGAQAYEINGRKVTKANLPAIQSKIKQLESRLQFASGSSHGHVAFGRNS